MEKKKHQVYKETIILDGEKQLSTEEAQIEEAKAYTGDSGVQNIVQPTEMGDTLKELNKDNLEPNTRMSGIDLRSRLHYAEVPSILAVDTLVALKFLPTSVLSLTRQKKRLSVSIDGKGRDDIVNIVAGKREQEQKALSGFMDRGKNFMGGGK